MKIIYMNAARDTITPSTVANLNGAIENEVMPSMASENREKKFQDDLPATRSPLSKSISFFRNPIQQNIPLV